MAVIVPTYRRPTSLRRCLEALRHQTRPPDRIVVVSRADDQETADVLDSVRAEMGTLEEVRVREPGQVAAIAAAVRACREDIVAHTDDDAAPFPDWIERLLSRYEPTIGGVGGRDVLPLELTAAPPRLVGKITWFGRLHGNHHLGDGPVREVDVLKAVNMSMRRELWRVDSHLRGPGAQTHMEVGLCLQAKREGWRLIYDPQARVAHYPAPRTDRDRLNPATQARADVEFNYAYQLARHLPLWHIPVAATYIIGVGTRWAPGFIAWLEAIVREPKHALRLTGVLGQLTLARIEGLWAGLLRRADRVVQPLPPTREATTGHRSLRGSR